MLNNAFKLDDLRFPPANRLEQLSGKRRITAETALCLARYFGTSPQFWMGLLSDYDLDVATDALGNRLDVEVRPTVVSG
jgi:plasmid maintenance system antidote protein VapI